MKKYTFLLIYLSVNFCIFGYDINIRVEGIKSSKVILARYFGDQRLIIDSTYFDDNGNARFSKNNELISGIYIFILSPKKLFEVLIDGDSDFTLQTDTSDLFFNLSIIGSEPSLVFYNHQRNIIKKQKLTAFLHQALSKMSPDDRRRDDIEKKIKELQQEIKNLNDLFILENQGTFAAKIVESTIPITIPKFEIPSNVFNKDSVMWMMSMQYFKYHYFDNCDLQDDRLLNTPIIFGKLNNYFNQLLYPDPDSIIVAIDYLYNHYNPDKETRKYISGFILTNFNKPENIEYEDVLLYMTEHYIDNIKEVYADYKVINDVIFKMNYLKKTLLGQIAPDLKGISLNGENISLYETKSKYMILIFWNPECPHCEKELGKLKDFYNANSIAGLDVFAFCTIENKEEWQKAVEQKDMTWINIFDPENKSNFREIYQVFYTPKIYLLDENKKILAKSSTMKEIELAFQHLFN